MFADQLRGSSLGHVGEEPVFTPNLDAFAGQGVRFTRAVANAPLCCPMRASLITGQHPLTHGVVGNDIRLREDSPSIAKSLSSAGYRTGYVGKWHLDGPDRSCFTPPGPRRQGFRHWAACNCNHNYYAAYYYRDDPQPVWVDGYEPTAQTDLAIKFLEGASRGDQPWCLFLSWGAPHCPYDQAPEEFLRLYDPRSLKPRANAVNPRLDITAGYYAHISALDHEFGRLMASLDRLGLAENTLVIFTSDHGDMLFSHDRGWKSKPWRESVIVPFIARWPDAIPEGVTEDAPFGLVNTMPTLLSICGVEAPPEVEGGALPQMVLAQDGERPHSTPIYFHMKATNPAPEVWRGVVTRSHTYARFRDEPWVLHDDDSDPYQMRNLAGDPEHAQLQQRLETELRAWLDKTGDAFESHEELAERLGIELNERGVPPCYNQPHIQREMARRVEAWRGQRPPQLRTDN